MWGALWLGDPTLVVLLKTMIHINWGAQFGEDEKGTVRYDSLVLPTAIYCNIAKRRDTAGSELKKKKNNNNNRDPL